MRTVASSSPRACVNTGLTRTSLRRSEADGWITEFPGVLRVLDEHACGDVGVRPQVEHVTLDRLPGLALRAAARQRTGLEGPRGHRVHPLVIGLVLLPEHDLKK